VDLKVDETALGEDKKPDILKVAPIVYATKAQQYHRIGDQIGKAFEIGRKIQ